MKYIRNLTFVDESTHSDLVEKYKSRIIKEINEIADSSFEFDLNLTIKIIDNFDGSNFVNNEKTSGVSTIKKDGSFVLMIGINSLERIEWDNGLDLDVAIFHELAHLYDFYKLFNNKYFNVNPLLNRQKNIENYVFQKGWNFWTEYFAYNFTFEFFYGFHDYPSFSQIVKGYQTLIKKHHEIRSIETKNKKQLKLLCTEFVQDLDQFVYALVKHISGSLNGKPKYYKIKLTKENEKIAYKLKKSIIELSNLADKLYVNTYGKGTWNKLLKLGDYIIRKFYLKFNFAPVEIRGHIALGYFNN